MPRADAGWQSLREPGKVVGAGNNPEVVVEWLSPLFAPGHWVPEQVERAAGCQSSARRGSALAAADPHVVVLGRCGFDLPRSLWSGRRSMRPNP